MIDIGTVHAYRMQPRQSGGGCTNFSHSSSAKKMCWVFRRECERKYLNLRSQALSNGVMKHLGDGLRIFGRAGLHQTHVVLPTERLCFEPGHLSVFEHKINPLHQRKIFYLYLADSKSAFAAITMSAGPGVGASSLPTGVIALLCLGCNWSGW